MKNSFYVEFCIKKELTHKSFKNVFLKDWSLSEIFARAFFMCVALELSFCRIYFPVYLKIDPFNYPEFF